MHKRYLAAAILMTASLFAILQPAPANAVSGWKAGRIISDGVFTNHSSMSVAQIQSFLNGKVSSCDTNGLKISEHGGPDLNGDGKVQRWEWAKRKYNQTKFVCLKDYVAGGKKASQIIYEKSQRYRISPKVILVLLQKEQSLVTDTWPVNIQYKTATGYGCPDTAPCDSQYYGLANQIDWAAKMFRAIMDDSPTWYTPYNVGTNFVQYNPQSSCGGSNVYIENRATQALYNYTPYQPNKAALNAGWGSASCGAYGNRNFFLYFSSWFGRPNGDPYKSLDAPRWMVLNKDVQKRDMTTLQPVDNVVPAGRQIYFPDKVSVGGQWFLRTQTDKDRGDNKGIPLSDISEITPTPISEVKFMELDSDRYKINPTTGFIERTKQYPAGTAAKFVDSITVNGEEFYRTEHDKNLGRNFYFRESAVHDLQYEPFDKPRFMQSRANSAKLNPATGQQIASYPTPTQELFASKVDINGTWFYRTESDTLANRLAAMPKSAIGEIPYVSFSNPSRWMSLDKNSAKVNPRTGESLRTLEQSRYPHIKIARQITVNNVSYYQTETDFKSGQDAVIPATDMSDIPYVPLDVPRTMTLASATRKVTPHTSAQIGNNYPKGLAVKYTTKITINGVMYLRSEYDTDRNLNRALPYNRLR